jgi:hypothetical protein
MPRRRPERRTNIKAFKNHLAADRTPAIRPGPTSSGCSCMPAPIWLLWSLRHLMPRRSAWRVMQFDTLRLCLIKLAARIVELKTQVNVHLPTSAPDQPNFRLALERLPRLVT